jgi:iron complex outermembrane receptor protein
MTSFEAGWSQHWIRGKMKTELTGFIMKGQNLIVMVPSAPPPPPLYKNTGNFNNKGIELALNYDPFSILRLHANYTFIDMKNPLPGTPEHNLFLTGTCSYRKFTFMLKLQNIFNLYNDTGEGTVEVIEKAYNILGTRIGYRVNKFMDVYLYGNNLLNQKYQINKGYPMPGVTLFAGVNLKLE